MKKILVTVLAMALLCIMAVGGTLSYFTDTDADVNVMTVGKVEIVQHEKYRTGEVDGEGNAVLADWHPDNDEDHNPKFLPYTGYDENNELMCDEEKYLTYDMLDTAMNAVDKLVTVENTGTEPAYVRTIFAFEAELTQSDGVVTGATSPIKGDVVANFADTSLFVLYNKEQGSEIIIYKHTVDGKTVYNAVPNEAEAAYIIGVYTYKNELARGETSAPSLLQVYLDKSVGNEFYTATGEDGYDILVLSQAVQTQGFEAKDGKTVAQVALDTAFGEVTAENAAKWFSETN